MELTRKRPVLFLLDEILHGTNSHDRAVGAEAVIRGLIAHGAIGLVTTHDLALAVLADKLAPKAANFHFQDHLEDGHMVFDYRLRPGVGGDRHVRPAGERRGVVDRADRDPEGRLHGQPAAVGRPHREGRAPAGVRGLGEGQHPA